MLTSVMQSGLQGMQSSLHNMSRAAQQIAQTGVNTRDAGAYVNAAITGGTGQPGTSGPGITENLTESLVVLQYNVLLFQASAKVVTASDTMIGSLLDVRA